MATEPVQGLDALLKALGGLPAVLQVELAVDALRDGAEPIRQRAAALAPDDPKTTGSRIRDNIVVDIQPIAKDTLAAKIGPSRKGFMGRFAELGTVHQRPKPFLRPAFELEKENAVKRMAARLAKGIEDYFRNN
jgi:HK97 gp10 family phage protein